MGRIGRSFQLVAQSYRILTQDKELMVLPLISGCVTVACVAAIAFGFGFDTARFGRNREALYLPVFVIYVVSYAVSYRFAVGDGGTSGLDPTLMHQAFAPRRGR